MKNHYLLTIAAGLAFSLAANAETLLPDSTITSNAKGENVSKISYSYDADGNKVKSESFKWDAAKSDWTPESKTTFTYDDANNNLGQLYQLLDGTAFKDSQVYEYEYDDQNRMIRNDLRDLSANRHYVETLVYEGKEVHISREDTTWQDAGKYSFSLAKLQQTLNDAGNIVKATTQSYAGIEDGKEIWYLSQELTNEYDSDGNSTKTVLNSYDKAGEISFTNETSWLRDGKNYTQTQRYKSQSDSDWTVMEFKSEFTGENPEINSFFMKNATTGAWELSNKTYSYYPAGTETANETITPDLAVQILTADGAISIHTTESRAVQVYAISGSCYYSATVNGIATVSGLPAGIYLVRVGNQSQKVLVK